MTTIASQTVVTASSLSNAALALVATSSASSSANQSSTALTNTSGAQGGSSPDTAATSSASSVAAAIAASANSGNYTFAQVAQNALTTLNAGIQKFGSAPDIHTTATQWNQVFGNMDRRSLYAVANNAGGQFSSLEQQAASSIMSVQESQALGTTNIENSSQAVTAFGNELKFLQSVGPEEKQSVRWAASVASAQVSLNASQGTTQSSSAASASYENPLVKVLIAAMTAGQSNASTDRSVGQLNTLSDLLSQPWAKGYESQIQQAYASNNPSGGQLNIKA